MAYREATLQLLKDRGPLHDQGLADVMATKIDMQFYSEARDALLKTVVE